MSTRFIVPGVTAIRPGSTGGRSADGEVAGYDGGVTRPRDRRPDVAPDPDPEGADPGAETSPWRRLDRRVAYENPWITVWHDEVTRPDGAPGIYGVVHFANLAVGVLAIDDRDRVLLVGQHRYALDAYSWEIPEGGGGPDESEIDAARRELAEETGYRAATWRELGRAALSNSVTDELAVFFVATDLQGGAASPEGTEELQTRWVAFDEALAMTLDGQSPTPSRCSPSSARRSTAGRKPTPELVRVMATSRVRASLRPHRRVRVLVTASSRIFIWRRACDGQSAESVRFRRWHSMPLQPASAQHLAAP